jgi:thiol:disulfide interchange protein
LLEADTLSDPRVRARLEAGFVALRVDMTEENDVNRKVAAALHVRGLPTLLVLDESGAEQLRIVHYVDADALLARLDGVTPPR